MDSGYVICSIVMRNSIENTKKDEDNITVIAKFLYTLTLQPFLVISEPEN